MQHAAHPADSMQLDLLAAPVCTAASSTSAGSGSSNSSVPMRWKLSRTGERFGGPRAIWRAGAALACTSAARTCAVSRCFAPSHGKGRQPHAERRLPCRSWRGGGP
eukprot:376668-Prymnesium_polylepis.1